MVKEISGHDTKFIMSEMPYSRGLQFRTLWWTTLHLRSPLGLKKIECERVGFEQSSPLKTVIA